MKYFIAMLTALLISAPLHAQTPPAAAPETRVMSDGVVRKIDVENNKITLKHGPIANLDMPGMTMVFRVVSPTLLNGVKVGDAVKFHVERANGAMTITAIQAAK
ncbi:MAG: copper-binding protein [Thiobacillus sp.]|nr:copper-binding protein [Thiobacillus sp.]